MHLRRLVGILLATPASLILAPCSASAQQALEPEAVSEDPAVSEDQGGLGEIVVTAQRRETNLQETPISISVLSGDTLEQQRITNALDLTTVLPNVNVNTYAGLTLISVRGIGLQSNKPGDEARIAFYSDEIYIARPFAQGASFFDVDRIEVLRGPQGTLFGRNATGGAFSVVSRAPTDHVSGYLNLTAGNYDLFQAEGALSGPIASTLNGRVAFQVIDRGGFGTNVFNGQDIDDQRSAAARASLAWEPSSDFSMRLIGFYARQNDASGNSHTFATVTPGALLAGQVQGGQAIVGRSRDVASDIFTRNYIETYGLTANLRYEFNSNLSLNGIFGYQKADHEIEFDSDGTSSFLNWVFLNEFSDTYSAEVRLVGDYDWLKFTAGIYYFSEREFVENRAVLNSVLVGGAFQPVQGIWANADLGTDAWAGFVQATFEITNRLSVTAGLRYSDEQRTDRNDQRQVDFVRPFPPLAPFQNVPGFPRSADISFNSLDPRISVEYKFTPDIFAYATFTTGFKSGGFNYGNNQAPFLPETIEAYEIGLRTSFFDNRLRFNASAFQYDYTNIQTPVVFFVPVSANLILNAAGARNRGFEVEINAIPTPRLRLDFSAAYLDAKFTEFMTGDGSRPQLGVIDLRGNRLPQAPTYTINAGAEYAFPLRGGAELSLRGEFQRVGRNYQTAFNIERDSQAAYNWVNAFLRFTSADERWTASLWGRNLTNSFVKNGITLQSGLLGGGGGFAAGAIAPPRTYGLTLGYNF